MQTRQVGKAESGERVIIAADDRLRLLSPVRTVHQPMRSRIKFFETFSVFLNANVERVAVVHGAWPSFMPPRMSLSSFYRSGLTKTGFNHGASEFLNSRSRPRIRQAVYE